MGILPWFLFLVMAVLFGITAWRMHVAERALRRAVRLLEQQADYLRGLHTNDARIEADRLLALRNTLWAPHAVVNLIDGLVDRARRGDQ